MTAAQRRVIAANVVYSNSVMAAIIARQASDNQYAEVSRLADVRDLTQIAVDAELASL